MSKKEQTKRVVIEGFSMRDCLDNEVINKLYNINKNDKNAGIKTCDKPLDK